MKILHIGLMVNGRREGLSKAFADYADQYQEYPLTTQLPAQIVNLSFTPDIIFLQIQNEKIDKVDSTQLLEGPLNMMRERGAKVINWTGDMRGNGAPAWMNRFKKCCDITAFSNERDITGVNERFLQIGIDPETFKQWPEGPGHDVVFMGNHAGNQFPLSQYRMQVVNTLQGMNLDVGIYGGYPGANGNLQAQAHNPFPQQSAESQIYSNSSIGISVSHFRADRYTSDRLFRLMGSHCFALVDHYPGIEKDFEIGKHLDVFTSLAEMRYKIQYYLRNADSRERIRDAGYQHVHANFRYSNMVENIVSLCGH